MKDPRNEALARQLLDYSLGVKSGETLYLEIKGVEALELGKEILRLATARGATTLWYYNDESMLRQFLLSASPTQIERLAELHLAWMKQADCYIGVRGSNNPFDIGDIEPAQKEQWNRLFVEPVHIQERVKRTRWVVLRFPNNAMAQLAETSQEAFEDFYYEVCCADYAKMSHAQDRLKALLEAADRVHVSSPGTDLTFSIKGIPVVKCDGHRNIPDGEVFTAPVRNSVNGVITYNAPSLHEGIVYNNVKLTFENGRIVSASADANVERLNKVLDTDDGARYIGEFSLGVNPFILKPMKDTLFDEKIAGSLHLTPGAAYDEADNGNRSAVHWDLVLIQRPDYGGGEIRLDGKLIRKEGVFTDHELEREFSPQNLRGGVAQ